MAWPTTSRQSRGYGRDHDKMRAHLIATVSTCEECERQGRITPGTIADHRIPKAKGGSDDRSNYWLLCAECDRVKQANDKGLKPRLTIGDDGWPSSA